MCDQGRSQDLVIRGPNKLYSVISFYERDQIVLTTTISLKIYIVIVQICQNMRGLAGAPACDIDRTAEI